MTLSHTYTIIIINKEDGGKTSGGDASVYSRDCGAGLMGGD